MVFANGPVETSSVQDDLFNSPGIHYNGSLRLFRLRCKDSLYAFRVDDQRNLEHLYWGPVLPAGDDITYLTRSHVPAPFDPRGVAGIAERLGLDELMSLGEGVDNLSQGWRVFTRKKNDQSATESVQSRSRRLENASWRLWHMARLHGGDSSKNHSDKYLAKALNMSTEPVGHIANTFPARPQPPISPRPTVSSPVLSSALAASHHQQQYIAQNYAEEQHHHHLQQQQQQKQHMPQHPRHGDEPGLTRRSAGHSLNDMTMLPAASSDALGWHHHHHHHHGRSPTMTMIPSLHGLGAHVPSFGHGLADEAMDFPGSEAVFASRPPDASLGGYGGSAFRTPTVPLPPLPLSHGIDKYASSSLLSGLDLDGHRGSRHHFEAKLKSRIRDESESMTDSSFPVVGSFPGPVSIMDHLAGGEDAPNLHGSVAIPGGRNVQTTTYTDGSSGPRFQGDRTGLKFDRHSIDCMPRESHHTPKSLGHYSPHHLRRSRPSLGAMEALGSVGSTEAMLELNQLTSATNWEPLDPEVVGKSSKLLEFSDYGTGDFREPSFRLHYDRDGSSVVPLEYSKHRIFKGKPAMPAYMPGLYTDSPTEASTLVVEMIDRVTELKINLYFTVYHEYDVITRRTVVVNDSDQAVCLNHVVSATVDFDAESTFHMTQLSGGWARERQVVTRKLDDGLTVVKSSRGASSHQFNPFMVISPDRDLTERTGECFAFCLVYSGNFLGTAEVTEYRRLRVNLGINPEGFTWHLAPTKNGKSSGTFYSPEVVMSYSNAGMGAMSRQLHRLFRERLTPRRWRYKIPPVILNTWEAAYFDVTHDLVMEIARKAVTGGIELLVLDDGWFGVRNDTYSGLGDWVPNYSKLPHGLDGLAREINNLGMKFGIWVEPEMVSMDSELYRKHPDWCLHVPCRSRTTGRNQLTLDFSRQCVRDNIFDQLKSMLESANIEYVKWDMNRHLTEVFSQDWDAARQGEISHRYMLGVYEVFSRITNAFPDVLFVSCSGGGGRFDAGMLYFSPFAWASDNTDALSRVKIQYGTSLAYPAGTMGAHVSTVPNHQTLRTTTVKTRSLIAMSGTFGYELDPRSLSESDIGEIQDYISLRKRVAPLVFDGDMYRLWSPFTSDSAAWMFVSRDKRHAVVIATNVRREVGRLEPRLKLDGLIPSAQYSVEELSPGTMARNVDTGAIYYEPRGVYQYGRILTLSGMTLCRAGLPIKFMFDADSVLFEVKEIGGVAPPEWAV